MAAKKKVSETQTAGENVYKYLRTSIIELRVKPGQTINMNELGEFLKVSRSPIRDALIQLGKDGLVETTPQKGTIVSKIDVQRVKDERFLRACIEERIMEEFLNIYQPSHIESLRKILEEQKKAFDAREFLRLDDAFHSVFFDVTNRPYCLDAVLNMSSHYYRIRLLSLSESGIRQLSLSQHEEILKLVLEKDISKIKKLLEKHIVDKDDEENQMKREYPDLFTGIVLANPQRQKIWEKDFLSTV